MKVLELYPQPIGNILFQRDKYLLVPEFSGCYVLVNADNDILYIGKAVKINQRFQQHLDNPEKTRTTQAGIAWKFWYLEYDATKLSFLENSWLQEYQRKEGHLPILNKNQAPIE